MIRFLFVVLLTATASTAEAGRRRDVIVDTCSADRSWVAYRTAFNAAIARHDAQGLLRLVATDISFDGAGDRRGRAAFARHFGPARPAASRLWGQLATIMRLGCARGHRERLNWVPSIFRVEEDDPDDATYAPGGVVIGANVPLRAARSDSSRVVARLSWEGIFLPEHDDGRGEWVWVSRDNDRQGFLRRSQVQSLTGPYALFRKERGQWRMAFFGTRE